MKTRNYVAKHSYQRAAVHGISKKAKRVKDKLKLKKEINSGYSE